MSRPPRPHPARSTGAARPVDPDGLDYLPPRYADLLATERAVAVHALGRGVDQTGDTADALMQLSALVGHVLAVYQRQYAREAFLGTAQAPSSLVRHAHRLGTEPDPGLAASGYAVLVTKPGVSGTVPAGQQLASVPFGLSAAQDYETGEDVEVDAALDLLRPLHATQPQVVAAGVRALRLEGVGLGLVPGDEVALIGAEWQGLVLDSVTEADGQTLVALRQPVSATFQAEGQDHGRVVLARPAVQVHSFGAGADPVLFPPAAVRAATNVASTTYPRYWFTADRTDGGFYQATDVYLAEKVDLPLGDDWMLRSTGVASSGLAVFRIEGQGLATVTLHRANRIDVTPQVATLTPKDGGFVTTIAPATTAQYVVESSHVSGTVTALRLADRRDSLLNRSDQPVESTWSTGWTVRAPVAGAVPNPRPLTQPLVLPGALRALAPGRPVIFADPDSGQAQVVRLRRVEVDEQAVTTSVEWDALTPDPPDPWTLDRLVVHANVAPVSHGRTVRERLAPSDGVTPFQRAVLKETPLTYMPGAAGAVPQLELRVAGVLWSAVVDFAASGPQDRHFRLVTDAESRTTVLFGDGRTGAVPPASALIEANYRVGRGSVGNLTAGRLSRIKRAHPLLSGLVNLTPVSGGTEPAAVQDVRSQATLRIRTFDRAVSVDDLADLALTMPGIARAAVRWDQRAGAVLVVATHEGEPPNPMSAVRAFLDARRDTGVPLALRGPAPHDLDLAVEVDPDPAWLPELVTGAVRAALTGRFSFAAEDLGATGYLSEVYALLEGLGGVVSVRVTRFATAGTTGTTGTAGTTGTTGTTGTGTGTGTGTSGPVADAVRPSVEGWLRLLPQNLGVVMPGRPT